MYIYIYKTECTYIVCIYIYTHTHIYTHTYSIYTIVCMLVYMYYIFITGSLCCTPEINITLQINYISIKKNKLPIIFQEECGIYLPTCRVYEPPAAAKSLQLCPTLCNPIDGSPLGSPSLGFSRQEHWSGLPFPSPYEPPRWPL